MATVRVIAIFGLLVLATDTLAPAEATAGTLFAGTGRHGGGLLITIDLTTGAGTLVGPSGFDEVSGLAFDRSGVLFGVTSGATGPSNLIIVNTTTGAGTSIGAIASTGPPGNNGFGGLAFDRSGTLFASAWNNTSGELWTLNTSNAAQTLIGTISGCTGNNFVAGLAFSPRGTLFGSRGGSIGHVENLVTLNPKTAACAPIGSSGGSNNEISDLAFDPDTGILYGATGGEESLLVRLNPRTGAATAIGPIGFEHVGALAIRGTAPVPALGEAGRIAVAILLAVAAAIALRRRGVAG